ncbi:MAG: tRNA (adenosine(37)-N6)-threonylcarbamoyltransferase complex ATPase subunit type 1 TsaE [Alphaproteobacteria bacterium]|nr:tRNA (adenosine(37)-N6)-threonylcarbamoyltransferase complex ATPase subunit type 1 TsaE [Alphaproteobacteria bacterium]
MDATHIYRWDITLPNETDTLGFAQCFAAFMHGHETILLKGTLGSGKTTFARAFIRSLCGENTEVVSPSFMLVQNYDAMPEKGAFVIQHFDLYRLEHPQECWELGLEETLENALVIVEWPEIAEALWPATRLEITISHDDKNDGRRLHVAASGTMVATLKEIRYKWDASRHD